jgi:hypothetical protein
MRSSLGHVFEHDAMFPPVRSARQYSALGGFGFGLLGGEKITLGFYNGECRDRCGLSNQCDTVHITNAAAAIRRTMKAHTAPRLGTGAGARNV